MVANPRWIDASISSHDNVVLANADIASSAGGLFSRVQAIMSQEIKGANLDAAGTVALREAFDSACDKVTGENYARYRQQYHNDSIGTEGGGLWAGALRQVLGEVLEEKTPQPNGLKAFKVDSSLPVGTRTFEVRREFGGGEARVHRGGTAEIPTVNIAGATAEFHVRNYVTSAVYDVFEEMSASVANVALAAKLLKLARRVLERFTNEMIWFGDPTYKIYGVLNYPWLDKIVSSLNFYGTPADSRTILDALNGWLNRQKFLSKGVFGPNKMATSPRVGSWIMQTIMGTTSAQRDRTIGEAFLAGTAGRLDGPIEQFWELEGVLGADIDAILFYRNDEMGILNVMPGGGIKALPFHSTDVARRQILFMPHGGVLMQEVGNMLLVFVNASA
jgi:hypothetical protein